MFKSKSAKIDPNVVETVIGESVVIEGAIKSQTSIQIDGQVIGEVEVGGNVLVGEKGRVNANITAKELTVAGTVNGNVQVQEKLTIKSKGKLIGEIKAKFFVVDEGGKFLGRSYMEAEQAEPAKNSVANQKVEVVEENQQDEPLVSEENEPS